MALSLRQSMTDSSLRTGKINDVFSPVSHSHQQSKFGILSKLKDINAGKVGMGGLGKTTLAQLVYNNPKVKEYFNLQTLRLNAPSKLPKGMRYMVSLRHLYIESCDNLKSMQPGLGELRCLQTLTCYIVGTGVGNKIGELKTLNNLGGKLEMYNLGEVGNAREANMVSKQNLNHLALCWGMPEYYSEAAIYNGSEGLVVDLEVLDALKPCNNLKVLRITGYRGDKFPVWMTEYDMLENLVELYITNCRRCSNVPPLHMLPFLQILHIECMHNLRHLCCENAQITFPALISFNLERMPNLDCWCECDTGEKTSLIFSVLSELSVIDCPKLSAIPITPKLEKMTIKGNKTLSSLATGITNVRSLSLDSEADETLSFKPWESPTLKPWESLQELTIHGNAIYVFRNF